MFTDVTVPELLDYLRFLSRTGFLPRGSYRIVEEAYRVLIKRKKEDVYVH